jgi:hypothetical protein
VQLRQKAGTPNHHWYMLNLDGWLALIYIYIYTLFIFLDEFLCISPKLKWVWYVV